MGNKTPLYNNHLQANAKIVDFAGWDMPLHYGSQVEEHHNVRQDAGIFDVSHMTIVDFAGSEVQAFLRYLLANDVARLTDGKALYTCMLNPDGGIIDDLIVYRINEHLYRLIVNSGTHDKDLAWIKNQTAQYDVEITERTDLAMVAIQGPHVKDKMVNLFGATEMQAILNLKPFSALQVGEYFIARTGYTGEDGFEIILPGENAATFWMRLTEFGFKPAGLGARDTLRLEAGLNLYGSDMDETVSPLESNLAWTVAFDPKDRDFIGRKALETQQKQGVQKKLVGLVLEGKGVLRNHQKVVVPGAGEGEITSGSFSPTLNKGIALARVPNSIATKCEVEIRGKLTKAQIVKPPFVKQGKKTFETVTE